jgi:hypothetical protein
MIEAGHTINLMLGNVKVVLEAKGSMEKVAPDGSMEAIRDASSFIMVSC